MMPRIVLRVRSIVPRLGEQPISVSVFAGAAGHTLQSAGTLRLYRDEWTLLHAALQSGIAQMSALGEVQIEAEE